MSCTRWVLLAACLTAVCAAASEPTSREQHKASSTSSAAASVWSAVTSLFSSTEPETRPIQLAQAGPAKKPALPLPEQVAVPPPPRFDIQHFDVQGNSLLSAEEVAEAVGPYTGKSKDFADVQRALEALQRRYQQRGFGAAQVVLPEQELEQGVIVLRVIEPKLGKVTVEGNEYFDWWNIRRSLPALQEGTTPNALEIGRNARLANENAAKRTTVLLRPGANEGEMDATVRVQDEKFWRAAVSFDNTGSPTTGMYRLGVAYQHSNLFNLDNTVTIQYQLDPEPIEEADQLKVLGVGYRIPLYGQNASIDLLAGYSSIGSASGQVIQGVAFNIAGSGTIFGARYNYTLPRPAGWGEYDHRISVGLDYKAFSNQVAEATNPDTNLTPDVTVHPLSVTYSATKRMQNAELGFFGTLLKNIHPHGSDASAEHFNGPPGIGVRPGVGEPWYTVFRYGINYARALPHDMQLRANMTGQWTRDALVPGEQFGIGGWDNLRGMLEREGASDRGYRASIELYSPDVASGFGMDGGRLRFLTFFDFGKVKLNHPEASAPCAPTACGFSASSFGFGMRLALRQGVSARLDYGRLLDGGVVAERGDDRWHFGVAVAF
ncbi:MAG: ShlB/FhaC/HecB family hemolysin secretion/activation protein [Betaproteobacteria bacterium]|nr:ShlB/FhaC/HecB family hemolysin secretion/activation protein [Betaproteobacteria bacterium]